MNWIITCEPTNTTNWRRNDLRMQYPYCANSRIIHSDVFLSFYRTFWFMNILIYSDWNPPPRRRRRRRTEPIQRKTLKFIFYFYHRFNERQQSNRTIEAQNHNWHSFLSLTRNPQRKMRNKKMNEKSNDERARLIVFTFGSQLYSCHSSFVHSCVFDFKQHWKSPVCYLKWRGCARLKLMSPIRLLLSNGRTMDRISNCHENTRRFVEIFKRGFRCFSAFPCCWFCDMNHVVST